MAPSKKKPSIRITEVKRTFRLTPNMQRVTLSGDGLLGFPTDRNGANLKLLIPENGSTESEFRKAITAGDRPPTRTYTVRDYRKETNELDIDFVVHGNDGPASRFAINSESGDIIGVAGPGPLKLNRTDAEWFLFCADMSALPAATSAIEMLADDAMGVAFFEVTSAEDKYPISAPQGVKLNWLIHADPHKPSRQQLEQIKAIDWPDTPLSVFAAGEHSATMAIRDYVLKEKKVPRENTYISGDLNRARQ